MFTIFQTFCTKSNLTSFNLIDCTYANIKTALETIRGRTLLVFFELFSYLISKFILDWWSFVRFGSNISQLNASSSVVLGLTCHRPLGRGKREEGSDNSPGLMKSPSKTSADSYFTIKNKKNDVYVNSWSVHCWARLKKVLRKLSKKHRQLKTNLSLIIF